MRYAWTLLFKIISYLSTYLRTKDSPSHFAIYLGWFCGYFGSRPSTTTLDKFSRLHVWHLRCVWRNSCTRAKCFPRLIIDISLPKLSFDRYNFLVYWDIYSWLMISIFEANYYYCLLKKKTNISAPEVGSKMNNTGLNSRDAILQRIAFKPDNPVEDSCTGREKNYSKQCLPPLTHRQVLCDFPFRSSTSCTWLKFASCRIQLE